jgi:4-amino-4-deoxy-L-arabinose transferase-like glycosyltransferase
VFRKSSLILIAILVFDVWLRGHTFAPTIRESWTIDVWPGAVGRTEPLDCDEAAYAYIGHRIVRGDVMYRDLTENKPPGGYWLYALTVAIGGANELTIRAMPIPFVLATVALIWWIGIRLRGPGAAALAAMTYSMVSTDPYLFGNGANMEHFLNLFSVASLALMVDAWSRAGRSRLWAAGACLGAACLVKQVAVTHCLVYAVALLARARIPGEETARPIGPRVRDVFDLTAGFILVLALAALVLIVEGAGPSAFDDIVRYGGALATETPPDPHAPSRWVRWVTGNADPRNGQLPWPFGRTDYLVWWGTGTWPFWLAAIPAIGWLAFGGQPRSMLKIGLPSQGGIDNAADLADPRLAEGRLVAAWSISAWVQVALPGLFWPHYYLLPLAGLAIATAVFLVDFSRSILGDRRRALLWTALALGVSTALVCTVWLEYRDYLRVAPEELTIRYKGGQQWVTLRAMGEDLKYRSRIWHSPHMYVWGWQSPLFFYSGIDGVSRHFFADPLLKAFAGQDHPLIKPRTERIMRDLQEHRPEMIFCGDPPFPALSAFLHENYLPSHITMSTPDGRGLWIERSSYGAFETAGRAPLGR